VQNSPLPHYQQHHRVEPPRIDAREFRPGWRVKTRLAALFENDKISREAFVAGMAWKGWVEQVGHVRVQSWAARISRGLVLKIPSSRQLDSACSLQDAARALGQKRVNLLMSAIVDDLTWVELGRRLRVQRQTAVKWAVEAVEALAMWRDGKPVPKLQNQLSKLS
jgi:hypothetical protein